MARSTPAVDAAVARIVDAVVSGRFSPGTRLPGERALATELGISRMTARAGLQAAAAKGLIQASPQRGWYVVETTVSEPPAELQSFTEMAVGLGLTPTSRLIHRRVRTATLDEAGLLNIAPSSPVIDLRRVRALNGRPVNVEDLLFAEGLFPWLADADLTDRSIYELLGQHGHTMSHSRYTVHAENAGATLAELLGLPPGGAVLVAVETARDTNGTVVLHGTSHYRGDAYRFTADLWRKR
ncbi:MAG: GntR family transcriptional regulator [Microlunatus sp.]|nr:GntR family transcriptional regulator [Microlunatus sp.]